MLQQSAFLERTPPSMTWDEYGTYLAETTPLTNQQAGVLAGSAYRVDQQSIANALGTTVSTVRSQKNELPLENLPNRAQTEVHTTPVPSVPMRFVGQVEYMLSDAWPHEQGSGTARVYISVREQDAYAAVIEEYTAADEETPEYVFGQADHIRREIVYESLPDLYRHSPHAPSRLSDGDPLTIDVSGAMYQTIQERLAV